MKEQEEVTYQSDVADKECQSADGFIADMFNPPGLCDDLVSEPSSCGYSKDTIGECDLPAVHVKEKNKVSPSPSVGTVCSALSSPSLASKMSPSVVGDIKPKIRRDDLPAYAQRSLFIRPKPLEAVSPAVPIPLMFSPRSSQW